LSLTENHAQNKPLNPEIGVGAHSLNSQAIHDTFALILHKLDSPLKQGVSHADGHTER